MPVEPSPLSLIRTPLNPDQVREKLLTASKRGRMAGYNGAPAQGLFSVAAFGHPFEGDLMATSADGTLNFELRMHRKLPVIFAVVLLLTIWPGVYLTDQLIPGEWGWIPTAWWYLPITVIPIPWVWRSLMRKSRATMDASARESIAKIAAEIDGTIEEPRPS